MSKKLLRRSNAFKHGAFSKVDVLPWEDPEEFAELQRQLIEEHQPRGPLQGDCINTILSSMWRKRRVRAKRNFDIAADLDRVENQVLWEDPPPLFDTKLEKLKHSLSQGSSRPSTRDDYEQLLAFSKSLYGGLESKLLNFSIQCLPVEFKEHLLTNLPEANFESRGDWIVALKREVDGVLMPMVRSRHGNSSFFFERASAFLDGHRLMEDLDIEERLDATIDRALKRLFQLKLQDQLNDYRVPSKLVSKPVAALPNLCATSSTEDEGIDERPQG